MCSVRNAKKKVFAIAIQEGIRGEGWINFADSLRQLGINHEEGKKGLHDWEK